MVICWFIYVVYQWELLSYRWLRVLNFLATCMGLLLTVDIPAHCDMEVTENDVYIYYDDIWRSIVDDICRKKIRFGSNDYSCMEALKQFWCDVMPS